MNDTPANTPEDSSVGPEPLELIAALHNEQENTEAFVERETQDGANWWALAGESRQKRLIGLLTAPTPAAAIDYLRRQPLLLSREDHETFLGDLLRFARVGFQAGRVRYLHLARLELEQQRKPGAAGAEGEDHHGI